MAVTSVFEFGAKGAEKLAKTLEQLTSKGLDPLARATKALAKDGGIAGALSGNTKQAIEQQKQMVKLLEETNTKATGLKKQLTEAQDAETWADVRSQLDSVRSTQETLNDELGRFTRLDLSGVGSLAKFLGFQELTDQFQSAREQVDSVVEAVDTSQIPSLQTWGTRLKDIAGALRSGGGSGGLKDALGGLVESIGPVNILSGLAAANLVVWNEAIRLYNERIEQAKESARAYVEGLQREHQVRIDINRLIEQGDREGAQQRLDQLVSDRERINGVVSDIDAEIIRVTEEYNRTSIINIMRRNELDARYHELQTQRAEQLASLGPVLEELVPLMQSMPAVEDAEAQAQATERLREAERSLTEIRTSARDATERYETQLRESVDEYAQGIARDRRERQRSDERAERDHQRNLSKIVLEGSQSLEAITREYYKSQLDQNKQWAKEDAKSYKNLNKQIASTLKEGTESLKDAVEKREKALRESQARWDKERVRAAEDSQDALWSAEFQNDAAAFVQQQRDFAKQERRAQEDRQDEQSQEAEQFAEEQATLRQQASDRIEEARASFNEEMSERREERADQLAEQRQANDERLAEQRAQNARTLAEAIAAHEEQRALEREDREWQDMLRREEQERAIVRIQEGFNAEIDALKKREQDTVAIIQSGGTLVINEVTWRQLQEVELYRQGTRSIISAIRAEMAVAGFTYGSSQSSVMRGSLSGMAARTATRGPRSILAAEGAVADQPTFAVIGERQREIVLPLERSQGIPSRAIQDIARAITREGGAPGGKPSISFGNITVSGEVTVEMLKANLTALAEVTIAAVEASRTGSGGRGLS